jgi:hypothetical protein
MNDARRYDEMTVPELKKLAAEAQVEGRSKMRKQELITALSTRLVPITGDEAEELFTREDECGHGLVSDDGICESCGGDFQELLAEVEEAVWSEYITAWNRRVQRPSRTARRRLARVRKQLPRSTRRRERRASVRAQRAMRKILTFPMDILSAPA